MNNTVSTHEALYATVPMKAVHVSSPVHSDDEEVYTAFEQAIRTRLTMYGYRVRSTDPMLSHPYEERQTEPIVREPQFLVARLEGQHARVQKTTAMWNEGRDTAGRNKLGLYMRRKALLICFAVMCMLAGFDLMGLLILHMR